MGDVYQNVENPMNAHLAEGIPMGKLLIELRL